MPCWLEKSAARVFFSSNFIGATNQNSIFGGSVTILVPIVQMRDIFPYNSISFSSPRFLLSAIKMLVQKLYVEEL
jgi:hypothetical protein